MASIAISAPTLQGTYSLPQAINRKPPTSHTRHGHSLGLKQVTHVVALNVEGQQQKAHNIVEQHEQENQEHGLGTEELVLKFIDERWKKGNWDLNMFVKDAKMDWDSLIVAEAKRRKFLELHPEASTNEEPVLFQSSIIPWWAWLKRSYLPEAELLNGRAAMLGFFMSYIIDVLTGFDMVGQAGNSICKAGLLVTVVSVILLRRTGDFQNLKKLADEATFYDKQWQASWQGQDTATSSGSSYKTRS